VGERLGLQCLVTRGQAPIQLQWLRYDTPVLKLNLPSLSVSSPAEYSSTLLFESLSPLHRGNYTCEATNSAATVTVTVQLYVNGNSHLVENTSTMHSTALHCTALISIIKILVRSKEAFCTYLYLSQKYFCIDETCIGSKQVNKKKNDCSLHIQYKEHPFKKVR
jgi:hypothetical protein